MMPDIGASRDHDMLVRLDTKLDALSGLLGEVRIAIDAKADKARVEQLERALETVRLDGMAAKAEAARIEKAEDAITAMQNKIYWVGGAMTAVQFGLHFLFKV